MALDSSNTAPRRRRGRRSRTRRKGEKRERKAHELWTQRGAILSPAFANRCSRAIHKSLHKKCHILVNMALTRKRILNRMVLAYRTAIHGSHT